MATSFSSSKPSLSPLNPHRPFTPVSFPFNFIFFQQPEALQLSKSYVAKPPLVGHAAIKEGNESEEVSQGSSFRATSPPPDNESSSGDNRKNRIYEKTREDKDRQHGVLYNKCGPGRKDKIFKSIFSPLVTKSPKSYAQCSLALSVQEEQWKIAANELSDKLVQETRKRDEAVIEASRLKHSMVELEKKLNKLDIYCQNLKSGLELCTNLNYRFTRVSDQSKVIEHFLVSVTEARSSVRLLSRALIIHLKKSGGQVVERLYLLLQPYDVKNISLTRNPREILVFVEALLNNAFHEDFESVGFQKNAPTHILNPIARCEANFASFKGLKELTWEDVITKGTKHFSEDFSKFCDRKMSEIVAMLGLNRAWPEQILQSFLEASKAVWLVHLLAHSLHPSLPIFRVDKGSSFDPVYLEDMGGDKARKLILVPSYVKIMVAPGFFVYDNVVKCKVICSYHNNNS